MKQYREKRPTLVVGGTTRAFLGEYMAGGLILVLGRTSTRPIRERGVGSGIHGGKIIIRGDLDDRYLGVGARKLPLEKDDMEEIYPLIRNYAACFDIDPEPFNDDAYIQVVPSSSRPFAGKYTWE